MTLLFELAARLGLSGVAQRIVGWLMLAGIAFVAVLAIASIGKAWMRSHDRAVIRQHETQVELDVLRRVQAANDRAAQAHATIISATTETTSTAMEAANEAASSGADPVAAYFDSLRNAQSASDRRAAR